MGRVKLIMGDFLELSSSIPEHFILQLTCEYENT